MSGPKLLKLIIAVSAMAISYEGMSQGVMGAVNVAPEYGVSNQTYLTISKSIANDIKHRMGFADAKGHVIKPSLQGGLVSTYYAGALFGAFWAGQFSDTYGRTSSLAESMSPSV